MLYELSVEPLSQPKESCNEQDDHDETDDPYDSVHGKSLVVDL